MGRYNKILVAVDGSDASKNALRQSFKLAADEKKWITVVAVNPAFQGDLDLVGISNISEVLKGQGEKILDEAIQIAESEKASIKARLEKGEPFEKIVEVAEEENYALILMGRHGLSSLERSLMGSVTARVIGHFKGKTLIIPRDKSIGWKKILVPSDGSRYSEAAVDEAINYAKSYGGSLIIVSAVYTNDEFLANAPDVVEQMVKEAMTRIEEVKQKVRKEGVDAETFVREGEPFKIITELAGELNADTIIMGSHGRTGLKRIFMGSVTSRVIGYAPCPVMVIHQ